MTCDRRSPARDLLLYGLRLADPNLKARVADLGATPFAGSAAEFGRLIADETDK